MAKKDFACSQELGKIQQLPGANDWTLKIVGDGWHLADYKNYVFNHHIPNISFEGRQNPEPYYDEASIFLMTSGFEGWGLTLTESLQKGVVPVVMNTASIFQDIIDSGYNGFLTKGSNINSFVKQVYLLMQSPMLLRKMQENALESASKFTIENTINKWDKLLSSCGKSDDIN